MDRDPLPRAAALPPGDGAALPRGAVWTGDQTDLGAPLGFVFATAFDWGGMP